MKNRDHQSAVEPLEARIAPAGLNNFDLTNLNGSAGFTIKATGSEGIRLGAVSSAGDVNDDGFADVLIAVPANNNGTGAVVLLFGKAGGFPAAIELGALGSAGVLLLGQDTSDNFGDSVAGAGDVNNDGIADIIVGAPGNDGGGSDRGAAYVIYGRTVWPGTLAMSTLNGTNGFKVTGAANFDRIGEAVGGSYSPNIGGGGDLNGDGSDDIIIGAPGKDLLTSSGGAAYVVFGKTTAFAAEISVSTLTGTTGFAIGSSLSGESLGSSVSIISDVNGDGFDDIVVGKDVERAETDQDRGFVIFGRSSGIAATLDANNLTTAQGYVVDDTEAEDFGSIPQLADADGDGDADFFTLYERFDAKRNGFDVGYAIAKNKGDGFKGNPFEKGVGKELRRVVQTENNFTVSLDFGDFTGDGFPDIVIDSGETPRANLFFGKKASGQSLMRAEKDDGITFVGIDTGDEFDNSVNFIGDLNGDGLDDLIVRPPEGNTADKAYIVFGTTLELKDKARSATFTDVDGDQVTVKTSRGALDYSMLQFSKPDGAVDNGKHLDMLDITSGGTTFAGANITISVKKAKGGDGLVDVGGLDATGIDIGVVKIAGRLGSIDAGDADFDDAGLKTLDVVSLGRGPDGVAVPSSDVRGGLGNLKVKNNWDQATLNVTGDADSGLNSASVGGSFEGIIGVQGAFGSFKSGNILGGSTISAEGTSAKKTSFTAGSIADGVTLGFNNTLSKLAATQVGAATISADRIDSLQVSGDKKADLPGNFSATLTLDNAGDGAKTKAIGSAMIAGTVSNATIAVAGSVGSFSAAAIVGSNLFVGFTPTSAANPLGGGTFLADALLGNFTLDGKSALGGDTIASDDSFVLATSLGSVSLGTIETMEGILQWGFGYRDDIKSLTAKIPEFTYDTGAGLTQTKDDFMVVRFVA